MFLWPVLDPVESIWFDWFHNILTAGGIGQQEGNGYVHAILANTDIQIEDIDKFIGKVRSNGSQQKTSPNILKNNLHKKPTGAWHLLGFQTYSVLVGLKAFTLEVLVPMGVLPRHVACFLLLCTMVLVTGYLTNPYSSVPRKHPCPIPPSPQRFKKSHRSQGPPRGRGCGCFYGPSDSARSLSHSGVEVKLFSGG
jgi:hypothetical protein